MSPLPARETLVAKGVTAIKEEFVELNVNSTTKKRMVAVAERIVDVCLPQLHPHSCAGKSIQELMWDELMAVYERLVTGAEAADGRDPGRAEGMAAMLAIVQNPYKPNIDLIREQAAQRWDEAGEEE